MIPDLFQCPGCGSWKLMKDAHRVNSIAFFYIEDENVEEQVSKRVSVMTRKRESWEEKSIPGYMCGMCLPVGAIE